MARSAITALGAHRVEIGWNDAGLGRRLRAALGLGFETCVSGRTSFRIEFDARASASTLAGGALRVAAADWERFDPVRLYYARVEPALVIAAHRLGYHGLHAAAVAFGDRLVIVLGERHAGKSTVSIGLGRAGARLLSDDSIFFRFTDDAALEVCAYPRELHLERALVRAWGLAPVEAALPEYYPGADRAALPHPSGGTLRWTGAASQVRLVWLDRCEALSMSLRPQAGPVALLERLHASLLQPRGELASFCVSDACADLEALGRQAPAWTLNCPRSQPPDARYPARLRREFRQLDEAAL